MWVGHLIRLPRSRSEPTDAPCDILGIPLVNDIPADRRAFLVRLTAKGKHAFDAMAAEHESWVINMFSGLSDSEREELHGLLGRLKSTLRTADERAIDDGNSHRNTQP